MSNIALNTVYFALVMDVSTCLFGMKTVIGLRFAISFFTSMLFTQSKSQLAMKQIFATLTAVALCVSRCYGQKTDSLIKKLDSLQLKKVSAGGKQINIDQTAY